MTDRSYERDMYAELDPRRAEEARAALELQKRREGAMQMQNDVDLAALADNPHFQRWFWTVMENGGIYHAAFLAHDGASHYRDGRRALALQLLDSVLRVRPQFRITLSVEQAKLEESLREQPNPNRS